MKPNLSKILAKKFDPCKKYRVYVEVSGSNTEGYIFMHPKAVNIKSNSEFFILTYYFKQIGGKRNPLFMVDRLEGMDFTDRIKLINHFAKYHALLYSVGLDGIARL